MDFPRLHKPFDAVRPSAAEQIKRIRDIRTVPGLRLYKSRQPVHAGAQVSVTADDINGFETGGVIQHAAPP